MRVIVLSDSHGNMQAVRQAVKRFPCDLVIHLGDHARDALRLAGEITTPVEYVKGNCDTGDIPEEKLLTLEGKKLLITHGHRYHVKSGPWELGLRMKELGADAALYGHTHEPGYEFYDRGFLLNPGALCGNRTNGKQGFAYLEWKAGGQIYMQLMEI